MKLLLRVLRTSKGLPSESEVEPGVESLDSLPRTGLFDYKEPEDNTSVPQTLENITRHGGVSTHCNLQTKMYNQI